MIKDDKELYKINLENKIEESLDLLYHLQNLFNLEDNS